MCRHRLACLPLSHPFRSSASLLAPSCVSFLCPPIRLFISSCVPHRAYLVGMSVSSHPLIRSAHPPRSAYPPRLSCRLAGRPSSRPHLVMRPAYRHVFCLPPCVPLILWMRLLMSSSRSCVPLLPCRLLLFSPYRPAYSCREVGRCRAVSSGAIFSCGIFARSGDFLTVRVL